jgi:hypothetical protein
VTWSFACKGDLAAKHAFLAGEFEHWLDRVPAGEVVLLAGNHDQSIEAWDIPHGLRCHYLQDAGIELFGLPDLGHPVAAMALRQGVQRPTPQRRGVLASKFETIPAGTDIVVAHGSPTDSVTAPAGAPTSGPRR